MSQAGEIDVTGTHPEIPTEFIEDVGTAVAIANIIEILGTYVSAHNVPVQTLGSGNTVTITTQLASQNGSSVATKAGLASFDSAFFNVDGNGFVTFAEVPIQTITGNTGGAEVPDGSGNFNFLTANTTVLFSGTANTETLDFNNDTTLSLGLGSSFPSLTSGTKNVSVGHLSGNALTSGDSNVLIGYNAGSVLTTDSRNTIIGGETGTGFIGDDNTMIGFGILDSPLLNITKNCAFGSYAMTSANGNYNCAFGYLALSGCGDYNTGIGYRSLIDVKVPGSYNTALGYNSGSAYTGFESSNICIGNIGILGDNNVTRIGTSGSGIGQQNRCFIGGIDNVNVGSVAKVVTEASDQLGTATITAGTGISIVPTANIITINASGGGLSWSVVTGASQAMAVNHGYIANNAGTVAFTLPTTSAVGDMISVTGMNNATGWSIAYTTNQQIFFGTSSTTLTTGSLASSETRDSVTLVCIVANLTWQVVSSTGNITVV